MWADNTIKGNNGVSYNSTSEDGSGMSNGGSWVVSLEVSVTGVRVAKTGVEPWWWQW